MTDNMYIVIQFVGGGKVATYFGPRRANAQKYADAVGGTVIPINRPRYHRRPWMIVRGRGEVMGASLQWSRDRENQNVWYGTDGQGRIIVRIVLFTATGCYSYWTVWVECALGKLPSGVVEYQWVLAGTFVDADEAKRNFCNTFGYTSVKGR